MPASAAATVYAAVVGDAAQRHQRRPELPIRVAGYGGDGAVMEVVVISPLPCGTLGPVLATLYTNPPLEHFPFDLCATCCSPPAS